MPAHSPRMVFLTYISRSGSTYLSRLLDEYEEANVSLEARLPDDLHYGAISLRSPAELEDFLDRLYADEKFCSWEIARSELRLELQQAEYPLSFSELLPLLMKLYRSSDGPRTDVYKCGQYIHFVEPLRKIFPDAHFIFVLRDIRAVFGSQKRSPDSTYGKPMSGSPVTKALMFNDVATVLSQYENEPWFHLVKFEDLVANPEQRVKELVTALGFRDLQKKQEARYDEKIPEAQKHLHTSVRKAPQKQKVDAWKQELSASEIAVFEHLSGDILQRFGYELHAPNPHKAVVFLGVHFYGLMYALRCLKRLRVPRVANLLAPCYSR